MQDEQGFRLVIDRALLDRSGTISVEYLKGPFRRGFHIKASTQTGCAPEGGGCTSCG